MTRVCRTCGREVDLETGFYPHPLSRYGHELECRECKKAKRTARYHRQKVEEPEKVARWQESAVARWRERYHTDPVFHQQQLERFRKSRAGKGAQRILDYLPPRERLTHVGGRLSDGT